MDGDLVGPRIDQAALDGGPFALLEQPPRLLLRAHLLATREEAQRRLDRLARVTRTGWGRLRARRRLGELRAAVQVLARTRHLLADATPTREELTEFFGPVIRELERLSRRPRSARRPRLTPVPQKETLMPTDPTHRAGQVVEEPAEETRRREQLAAAQRTAEPPSFPPALMPYIYALEGVCSVPNFTAVRTQRALDLARTVLDHRERDREVLVAALFYRFLMRAARGGAA